MSLNHSPKIVTDGLILCLDAASRKSYPGSGTTWFDRSGNGNNGTLVNGVGYNSGNGGSLVFDGTNDYVDLLLTANLQFGTRDFAIEYYINSNTQASSFPSLFTNYNGWGAGAVFVGVSHQNYLNKYSFWINGQGSGARTESNISYNKWEHLVVMRDNGICKIYLNGTQDGTTIDATGIVLNGLNSSIIRVGSTQEATVLYNGKIAKMSIYNRALSPNEVKQNFNATRGRYGI